MTGRYNAIFLFHEIRMFGELENETDFNGAGDHLGNHDFVDDRLC